MQIGAASTGLFLTSVVFWGVLRHSKPAMVIFLIGVATAVASGGIASMIRHDQLPFLHLNSDQSRQALQVLGISQLAGGGIAFLATFFGSLRAFFTFFTTVPIGGVWIGTAALVCVLSVMSGFETDLREKILGSNAHIQITRDDEGWVLEDLGSEHGTFLGDHRIRRRTISNGDGRWIARDRVLAPGNH